MSLTHLLIVHPDAAARDLLASMLQSLGFRLLEAPNDRAAVRMLESEPAELVLAGGDPDDPDSLEFLTYVRRKHPRTPVILLWASAHAERSREAMRRGAASILKFPMAANQLRAAVSQALGQPEPQAPPTIVGGRLGEPVAMPVGSAKGSPNGQAINGLAHGHPKCNGPAEAPGAPAAAPGVVGEDPGLREAAELAATIAPTRTPVLIVGEHGTGKTTVARTLHAHSPRRDGPFLELACATMNEAALEVELFGRKGGYGEPDRTGRVAQAHGGTLFLDEVAELSPSLQYKLIRLLQDGEFEPVGSNQTARADVRLVVSTAEDLGALVDKGLFRADLYYRIGVVTLKLPPLRHRGSDIERLAEHFRAKFAREIGRDVAGFSPDALAMLRGHDWPGNVLELEHVVERAVIQCRSPRIEPAHLTITRRSPASSHRSHSSHSSRSAVNPASIQPLKEALEAPERQLILQALEALNWNRQETARVLDINRTTLYKKMKKYGLLYDEPVWAN